MSKYIFLFLLCAFSFLSSMHAQFTYTNLSSTIDKKQFCDPGGVAELKGTVRANNNVYSGYHFVGTVFHFYRRLGATNILIGNYTIRNVSGSMQATYSNVDASYFDGSKLYGASIIEDTYDPFAPSEGGLFSTAFWLPVTAFPNNAGVQLLMGMEAIDQIGNTSLETTLIEFSNPVLHPGSITAPAIQASHANLCGGGSSFISTNPDLSPTHAFTWYRDGALLTGETGSGITVSSPGTYKATVSDACISSTTDEIVISAGAAPPAPGIASSNGTNLCNGALTTISVTSSSGGTIRWSGGQTGPYITVSGAGNYRAYEVGACGNSDWSNTITITTMGNPPGPIITPNVGRQLCNGESVTLTVNSSVGPITWSTGQTGNSITVSAAGTYYATQTNACATSAPGNLVTFTTSNTPGTLSVSASASTICSGETVTLSTTPTAGGTVNWSNGATGNTITVSSAGSYYAWETNACGTGANSNTVNITAGTAPTPPVISTSSGTVLCNGESATLNATGANIIWSTGQTGASISVSNPGTYYATVTNGCGTSAPSNLLTFTTRNTPSAPVVNPAGPIQLCDGASTNLSVSGGGSFSWYRDGNYFSAAGNVITSQAGTYTVRNSNSCGTSPNSNAVVVTTSTKPSAPTVTPPDNQLLCNGESATFTASGTNITWSNGITGNTMTTSVAGTYYAYAQNSCGNSANSNSVVITTGNCPTPSPGTSFFICPGALKTLDAGAGYESYQWNNGETTQKINVGPGNYAVTVTKNGCAATSVLVTVSYYIVTTPIINPSGPLSFCNGGSVALNASNGTAYAWSTGATSSSISVTTPGAYYVTVTDANGCQATSAITNVVVNPLPTATISGTTAVCQNATSPSILFTGNNTTAPYTFHYKINGGTTKTITTVSGNSVSVNVPTDVANVFAYELVGVQESSSTSCYDAATGTATVTLNQLPVASISGTTTVCKNSSSPIVTLSATGGVTPYTFVYKVNGGAEQTIATTSGNSVQITVPTSTPGTFTYELVSVKESSGTTCLNTASGSATVTVRDLPTATIAGTTTVCQYNSAPTITFSGNSGTVPYTFNYRVNGGADQTISTISGNSVTITQATSTAATFTYSLISVSESGTGSCSNAATGSATIVVNPQPVSAIITAPQTHLCNGESGTLTMLNWQEGFSYSWYRDGVLFTTSTAQSITVTQSGSYTVLATSGEGCNAAGISNAITITVGSISTPVITGKLKVCEGGKTRLLAVPTLKHLPYELYRWTDHPLGDTLSNDKSFSAAAGQYQIFVRREGCVDSMLVAVTADDTEFPAGELKMYPKTIPYGGRTTLTAALKNTERFEWDFGDGRSAVTHSGSVEQAYYARSDSLLIRLRAVSERNCKTDFAATLLIGKADTIVFLNRSYAGNLKDWNFFPTPFRDDLKLSVILNKNEKVKLDFFTADGAWVQAYELVGRKGENLFHLQKLGSLTSGTLYFVTGIYNGEQHYDKIYKY